MQKNYDVLIVGGGLVGASLALALRDLPLSLGLIEAKPILTTNPLSHFDARSIALSYGSRRILEHLGVWDTLAKNVTPISQIHVSDKGHFGITHFTADEYQVPALGYVAEVSFLSNSLHQPLLQQQNLHLFCPATVQALQAEAQGWCLIISTAQGTETVYTKLIVAADGGQSVIRTQQEIAVTIHDYRQTAIIANVSLARPHQNIAYERFTAEGPLAMLPLSEQRCAMICTVPAAQEAQWLALSDYDFLTNLQQRFGYRLGRLQQVGQRYAFPLKLVKAQEKVRSGLVLLGNAAHTLHPVAAQGFNLSLRDVAVLAEVISQAIQQQSDIADLTMLKRYQKWRQFDQQKTIAFTDGLARFFTADWLPLTWGRGLGLLALEFLPPLQQWIAQNAMGINGR